MTIDFKAMQFAREVHKDQRRRYSNDPYIGHLAEVAGITASVMTSGTALATAWLHDTIEDQQVSYGQIQSLFGTTVARGVLLLSDLEEGNRATRMAASRARLAAAPAWVQSIKVADLISNTSTIGLHDPNFAVVYFKEKRLLLDVLTQADPRLVEIARAQVQ
jgi:guanosine-3',5'-bis(diphosphate) 3'-pyrophosphohydrolase